MGFLNSVINEINQPIMSDGNNVMSRGTQRRSEQLTAQYNSLQKTDDVIVNSGYANEVDINTDNVNRLRLDYPSEGPQQRQPLETDFLQRKYERELIYSNDLLENSSEQLDVDSHVGVKTREDLLIVDNHKDISNFSGVNQIKKRLETEIMRKSTGLESTSDTNWPNQTSIDKNRELSAQNRDVPTVRLKGTTAAVGTTQVATLAYPELIKQDTAEKVDAAQSSSLSADDYLFAGMTKPKQGDDNIAEPSLTKASIDDKATTNKIPLEAKSRRIKQPIKPRQVPDVVGGISIGKVNITISATEHQAASPSPQVDSSLSQSRHFLRLL
jgi:hypothetical protein